MATTNLSTKVDIIFSNEKGAPAGAQNAAFLFKRDGTSPAVCAFDVAIDDTNTLSVELDAARAQVVEKGETSFRVNARVIAVNSTVPTDFAVGDAISVTILPQQPINNFVLRNVFKFKFLYGTCSNLVRA